MDKKMHKEIIERLDEIEKKLDEILLRLPYYYTYTATYPPPGDTSGTSGTYEWHYTWPNAEPIDYGNEPDP